MTIKALIFDVDGTLAETEEGHRQSWNMAFAAAGLHWSWSQEEYRALLKITGGQERLRHFAGPQLSDSDIAGLHTLKNRLYQQSLANGGIALRPGIAELIHHARDHNLKLAIATTTSRANVDGLIAGTLGREALAWFDAICTAEDAPAKKPDPLVFRMTLEQLGVPESAAIVFEDSRNGVVAAKALNLPVVLSPSFYMTHEDAQGADMTLTEWSDLTPDELLSHFG